MKTTLSPATADELLTFIRSRIPKQGLFAGQDWRIATAPFPLSATVADEIESLGRVLLQFYRAVNLLYRRSVAGTQPGWIADYLDRGKDSRLIQLQRSPAFKNDVPRVIRPDILLTDSGLRISELDSVPGGIGLTAWLNQTYDQLPAAGASPGVIGGRDGMIRGFASIFGDAKTVHLVVSDEAATYRPEMAWLAEQLSHNPPRTFNLRDTNWDQFSIGDAVYRFFELFDVPNVANAERIFELAVNGKIRLTPPPKPVFEEKLLFALLWNHNLRGYWRQELGEAFLNRLLQMVPYTWVVDPTPLPPQGAIPVLNLTDWHQLKSLSQRERNLILKISGYSDHAWGARGVYLGSDLSHADWSVAVDKAIRGFASSPYVLQQYHKPRAVQSAYYDLNTGQPVTMEGRVRLCPYYFVTGEADSARPELGGVLATICPADKKIIHGMKDAILAPCSRGTST